MSDARHALLAEIVRVATGDAGLAALIGDRVFDGVPHGAEHPFVVVREMTTAALDGDARPSMEHRIELDAVSRTGRSEASGIADRLRRLIEDGGLAPAGHDLAALRHLATAVTGSRDGRSWRARVRFRAVTDEN